MRKKKIIVKNIYKSFKDKVVLNKLNLDVYESESLSIIGESGSGKSILTRCIVGLLNYDNGSINFENLTNINALNDRENNYVVEEVLSIVDRQEGGLEALEDENVKLKSLFTIKDFL